jgi:OmpA-OmpF porin, OOP family
MNRMKLNSLSTGATVVAAALALLLGGCSTTAGQQTNSSTAPAAKQSMTDEAIHADLGSYTNQQGRIKAVNDSGKHRVASYSLSKSQCWLDVALHEYSRNDRSKFPAAAFAESVKITEFLSTGAPVADAKNPALQTPLVNGATKLRQDLWDAADKLKGHAGWRCAEQKTACAEVELVHAGNEFAQQEWRHAKPYIQIAEDLIGDAQKAADACVPPPVVAAARPAPAPVPANLAANILFNFDKRTMPETRSYSKDQLDSLIAQYKSGNVLASSIVLTGHADRLNSTGDKNYNVKLSEDRVAAVKDYMVAAGIPANLISSNYKADGAQIEACTKVKFKNTAELQECLLPNRRVEVVLTGTKK